MPLTLRRGGLVLVAAVVVALLAMVILGSGRSVGDSVAKPTVRSAQTGASPALSNMLGVLRKPVTSADSIPARWERQALLNGVDSAILPLAHKVNTGTGATDWVIPSGGTVCLMQAVGDALSYGCAAAEAIANHAALSTSMGSAMGVSDSEVRVSGILPDGASDAALILADGSRQPVTVASNVYDAVTPRSTKQFEWTDAGGQRHTVEVASAF